MKKIAFLDIVHPILEEKLTNFGFECIDLTAVSKTNIESDIQNFHGIVIRSRFSMDRSFLLKASQLEFIARSGAGMENIDLVYCEKNNIQLFNAPEGNRNAVGEHALGMLLSLFNNLNKGDTEIRKGIWDREGNRGVELDGKTVGLIGYGNNGQAFAQKLSGFNVKVLTFDKYKTNYSNEFAQEATMNQIFGEVDVISFHIPQNHETKFMVDSNYLNQFKKNIYLINLSRGEIVKTDSLVEGLKNGTIKGACLDVLEFEKSSFEDVFSDFENIPTSFKYVLKSKNVILSPHVGGWTIESYYKLSDVLAKKVINFYK